MRWRTQEISRQVEGLQWVVYFRAVELACTSCYQYWGRAGPHHDPKTSALDRNCGVRVMLLSHVLMHELIEARFVILYLNFYSLQCSILAWTSKQSRMKTRDLSVKELR